MAKENGTIFMQIASYRDPELVPTIENALENAYDADRLVFAICRQYHPNDKFDDLSNYAGDKRFRIINVPYNETKGTCWARNQIQQRYKGEDYTLQLDSHMRFDKDWDKTLVDMLVGLQSRGYEKPLLTAYVPSYEPKNDPAGRIYEPWRLVFDRFIPEGAIFFLPETIPGWENLKEPVPCRFLSAHFVFTLGEFSKKVQHDPEFYFHGEEIALAARAYTHGYDLFHPHKYVVWHEYTREGRAKQWDDNSNWPILNNKAHQKNRILFGMEDGNVKFGKYGFGKERTLRDYEKWAGICFKKRGVQQYTLDKYYPPNPANANMNDEEFEASCQTIFRHCIDLHFEDYKHDDYDFWVVAFHGANGETLIRLDAQKEEVDNLLDSKNHGETYIKLWREYPADPNNMPKKWVVWPHSVSAGWCDRVEGDL